MTTPAWPELPPVDELEALADPTFVGRGLPVEALAASIRHLAGILLEVHSARSAVDA